MKLLHCADLHLGKRPVGAVGRYSQLRFEDYFRAFENCINLAVNQKVDVLVISGDLFDKRDITPEILEKTEQMLKILADNNIVVIITEGNHDNITPGKENESWIIYLEKKGLLKHPKYYFDEDGYHFMPLTINGFNFYGLGYPGSLANETLKALSNSILSDADKNIILIHTAIASDEFLPGTISKDIIDLLKHKAIYIAGGHFHSFQYYPSSEPFFFVPGAPEFWDLNEPADKKGFIIFDTCTKKFSFINSQPRNKIELQFYPTTYSYESFKEEFAFYLNNLNFNQDDIIIINVNLDKPIFIELDKYENFLLERGALKAMIRIKLPAFKDAKMTTQYMPAIQKIEKELIDSWDLFSNFSEDISGTLQALKNYQRENNKDLFIDSYDKLLEIMLRQGENSEDK
jgi:DNA repair exonuclease SbcCD nuclease subunit